MKPEELLNVETLPEDLHWLASEYRLQPNDPIYLLIAWHWHRIQKGEDTLRSALMDLKAAVDSRITTVVGTAETVLAVQEQLKQVQDALEQKPAALGRQLETDLRRPVTAAVAQINGAAHAGANLVEAMQAALAAAQSRQALAALLVGFVLGGSCVAIILLP